MEILLSYQVSNLQGIGKRREQEDSFTFVNSSDVTMIRDRGLFFLVCDGMGGMRGGREAGEIGVKSMRESFLSFDMAESIPSQIVRSLVKASRAVYERFAGSGGCTAAGGVIYREKLWFFSVGDSYLYLQRNGDTERLNRLMNVKNDIYLHDISCGYLDPAHGRCADESEALTSYIGVDELCDIDCNIREMQLSDGDVILAASDGVCMSIDDDCLGKAMMADSAFSVCSMLDDGIKKADRDHQDNYTALVIKCMY